MEYASALVRLNPGSEDKLEEWRSTLASRLDEAAATLGDEEVKVESYFTVEIGGDKYLLWYLRAQTPDRRVSLRDDGGDHCGGHHGKASDRHPS